MVINNYKGVSLVSLFDTIATLAEVLQDHLQSKDIVDLLLPLLATRLRSFNQNDRRILPLFEAYEQVISAIGSDLCEPHINEIYTKVIQILGSIKKETENVSESSQKDIWYFATDFLIRSIDLMHAINSTMKAKINVLLASDGYMIIELLQYFCK